MPIFKLGILVTADDKASAKLRKLPDAFAQMKKSVMQAVLAYGALQAAQKAIEFVKFGAAVEATESRFIAFAGGAQRADEMLQALNKASDHTLDRMSAMTTASTLMSLGLATTTEEMGIAGAMLGKLARQGLGAEGAMNSLTMLLANQSTRRLDDFSLSVEEVKNRQKELEDQGLSTEQAFKMAVYDTAAQKLAILGDTSQLAATQIGQVESAWANLWQRMSKGTAEMVGDTGALGKVAKGLNADMEAMTLVGEKAAASGRDLGRGIGAAVEATKDAIQSSRTWQKDEDELRATLESTERAIIGVTSANWDYGDSTDDAESGLADLEAGLANVGAAYAAQARRARETATEMKIANRSFTMDAAADWTSYAKDTTESARDAAADKEKIEEEHAANLAKIQEKGRAKAIRFDALAEQEKLDGLKWKLGQALQQQTEFTDKTRISVRNAKEYQIANLQEEIAEKEQAFANFEAGRLVKAGQNVDGLLAEEDRRYAAELEKLNESRTEQELAQRESLGRMVVEQWKAFALGTDLTQKEIDKVTMHFMEKYGLIAEAGVEMAANSKRDMELFAKHGIDAAQKIIDRLNAIPRHIEITFNTRQAGREAAEAEHGVAIPGLSTPNFAAGGTSLGGRTMVGELGAEMVDLPRGAQVTPASQVNDNRTYRFDQTVHTRASTHSIMNDFALAQAMAG